jgi:hypothetical protein
MVARVYDDSVFGTNVNCVRDLTKDEDNWGIVMVLNTTDNHIDFREHANIYNFSKALVHYMNIIPSIDDNPPICEPKIEWVYSGAYGFLVCEEEKITGVSNLPITVKDKEWDIYHWIHNNVPMVNKSTPIYIWYIGKDFVKSTCRISIRGYLLTEEIKDFIEKCITKFCGTTDNINIHKVLE